MYLYFPLNSLKCNYKLSTIGDCIDILCHGLKKKIMATKGSGTIKRSGFAGVDTVLLEEGVTVGVVLEVSCQDRIFPV